MGQVEALRRCLLRDCNDDIGGHLVNCHLSTESLTETDLIARATESVRLPNLRSG